MKRCITVVLLTAAVIALAGCGAGTRVSSPEPVAHLGPVAIEAATIPGLRLAAVPAGYRPPLSSRELVGRIPLIISPMGHVSRVSGKPVAHLWTVNGAYAAWVFTSHGPAGRSVSIYDLRGRRWTMSFLLPRRGAPCRGGLCGYPVNQGGLDMAAGYAERVAGAAHVFAGDSVDDANDHVVLQLVHAPQSVIHALNAAHPGTYVIHNDAPRTLASVMKVERALDWRVLQSKGIAIVSAGPDGQGRLMVGVTKDIPKAQAYFDATYGRGFVHVVHGERAYVT